LLLEPLSKLLSQPTARPNRGAIVARQQPGRRGGAGAEHGATVGPISSFFPGFVPGASLVGSSRIGRFKARVGKLKGFLRDGKDTAKIGLRVIQVLSQPRERR
jgi:hypothetical protein